MSRTDKDRPYDVRKNDKLDSCYNGDGFLSWMSNPPHWYINIIWNAPERLRERVILGEVKKEYNANNEVDDYSFENRPHRHCASYYWW